MRQSSGSFCYCCNNHEWSNKLVRKVLNSELLASYPVGVSVSDVDEDLVDAIADRKWEEEQIRLDVENEQNLSELESW